MKLTDSELCILQQALGLREMVQINTTNFKSEADRRKLKDTRDLRNKIISEIRVQRNYGHLFEEESEG